MFRSRTCPCASPSTAPGWWADGPTHAGSFDTGFLAALPGFVVMAASDEAELRHMVRTAAEYDEGPISFRYPRGDGLGVDLPERGSVLEIGKGRIVREGTKVALLSFGTRLQECLAAAEELGAAGLSTTVADARFAKPLDHDLIRRLAREHEVLVMVEEGAVGGFGSHVLQFLATDGLLDRGLKVRALTLPDIYQDHGKPDAMYAEAGLDRTGIVRTVLPHFIAMNWAMKHCRHRFVPETDERPVHRYVRALTSFWLSADFSRHARAPVTLSSAAR